MKSWRVVKLLIQNLSSFETFSPRSDLYLVCQVLTERWYLLSTLIPTYFKEENWKTMRFLVSRHMDNWKLPHNNNSSLDVRGMPSWQHTILTEGTDRTLWSIKCSRSAVFLKTHICENKRKSSSVRILAIFSMFLFGQQEEERWKKLASTQHLSDIGCATLSAKILKLIKTDNA